ncbi:MAG: hypothetical protein ABSG17_00865 [Spirochaetia bacterium]|jgi:hypothetical protein
MKIRWAGLAGLAAVVLTLLALTGCTTLDVKAPPGMFVSTGDYVNGVRTMGIIQDQPGSLRGFDQEGPGGGR